MKTLTASLLCLSMVLCACTGPVGSSASGASDTLMIENIFPFQQKHCHGSSITALPNGDLLVVWFHGSGERTADDVLIMGSRRNNKTGSWSDPFIMADVEGFPDINPVVFLDQSSRLWLVWYTVLAYQWESSVLKYRISENYMQKTGPPEWTWQDMIHIKPDSSTPDGIGRNDGFVRVLERKYNEYHEYLSSQNLIRPDGSGPLTQQAWDAALAGYFDIAKGKNLIRPGTEVDEKGERERTPLGYPLMRRIGWQTRNKPLFDGNRMLLPLYSDGFDFSLIAITENGGKSWSFSEPLVGAGPVQPSLLLRSDGSIIALMRDNGPAPQRLMRSISHDSGLTWSVVEDSDIPNPGSAADAVVLKSGSFVLVHNDLEDGRHRLSVWLSTDEGKTWPFRKSIVSDIPGSQTRAHYPAVIQGPDGRIHVTFTNQVPVGTEGANVKNIAHVSFSESWLMKN